mgnify:FL=1
MAELPKLYIDNPGGDWLQRKLEEAQEDYQTAPLGSSRRNLGGSNVTGYFKTDLDLSPDLLKDLPGALGEEAFRGGGEKLELLEKSILEQGYEPSPILVNVREDGQPFIVEGNHRVAEALKSGRTSIPVELRYLRGGEDAEGPLSMSRLREFYGNRLRGQEPPPTDQPRPPLLLEGPPEEQPGRKPSKGRVMRGIGSLLQSRAFPLIQAAQMGYDLLPEDKKFAGDFIDYLKETKTHELFGMDKSGLDYLKDLLGMEQTLPEPSQRISSKDTSIKQIAAVFKKPEIFDLKEGSVNLDIGGGRFDLGTDYLRNERGVENLVFDKFNRSPEHNEEVLNRIREIGGTDSATAANILNVIEEPEARKSVIQQSYDYTKEGGKVLFQIYEGSGTGVGRETTKGWQNNRKTSEYIPEIEGIFGKGGVQRKGNIIIAIKEGRPQNKAAGGFVTKPLYDDARVGGLI